MGSQLNITMRPKTFSEFIGESQAVSAIQKKLASGDVPRAFMLVGPFGTGKSTLAQIIAREVQGFDFSKNALPQVQEVNAANITGVDDMRELVKSASAYPKIGEYGVIILDEAHMLSKSAQNLLLKEFEAPTARTVWIVCTTEEDKILKGLREGRTFKVPLTGMGATEREQLVSRAAQRVGHTGDTKSFLAALTNANVTSPRSVLMAFELFHNGISIADAVGSQSFKGLPEFNEIAFCVVFGKWNDSSFDFRNEAKNLPPIKDLLKALDARLRKKVVTTDAGSEETSLEREGADIQEEDTMGRPEAARALRAITAAYLKGRVLKGGIVADRAAEALDILAKGISPNPFDTGLEYAATIGVLYRVNRRLNLTTARR
jgi:hypothetical protein